MVFNYFASSSGREQAWEKWLSCDRDTLTFRSVCVDSKLKFLNGGNVERKAVIHSLKVCVKSF